jgi:phosphoglycolate phosphatase
MTDLFFDLDGTLTDPARGITRCLAHALRTSGRAAPPLDELRRYIGPPLRKTFAELLATDAHDAVETAVAHYRERFSTVGMYENQVYADVPDGLAALRRAGHRLWVVTSKPEVYARRIVEHFALMPIFHGVHGSELSGARADKRELIAHVLESERLDPASTRMIGDRAEDVVGGRANGTGTVGVLWGYGSEEELVEARPDAIVGSMAELTAYLVAGAVIGSRRAPRPGRGS